MLDKCLIYKDKFRKYCETNDQRVPIPQALGSFGAQLGIGNMLTRLAVTLLLAAALEVCVVATAPVRTSTATNVRTMCFISEYP